MQTSGTPIGGRLRSTNYGSYINYANVDRGWGSIHMITVIHREPQSDFVIYLRPLTGEAKKGTDKLFWHLWGWRGEGVRCFCKHINIMLSSGRDQRDSRFSRILENFFSFSLLVLDLGPFQFHFHFSKKSEGILFFTFHFSKKVKAIGISLFFLEKKEWN